MVVVACERQIMSFLVTMTHVVRDWGMTGHLLYVLLCECSGCSSSTVCVVKWVPSRGDKFSPRKSNVGVTYSVVGEFL